jgi:hypothetical protein
MNPMNSPAAPTTAAGAAGPDTPPGAPTDAELRRIAKRRVDMKMGFYVHALVFVCVNTGLYLLNQFTGDVRWHQLPLWGWGLGLAIHGLVTLISVSGGDTLRGRMLDAEMRKLKSGR